jgi:HlyD family secretion protein
MKKTLALIALAMAAITIWFFTRPHQARVEESPFSIHFENVQKGDIRVEVTATGIVDPINKIEIKSKASGLIDNLPIEESDHVKTGQLIARLDQRDTRNAYEQAIADLEVAEANVTQKKSDFNRKKELYEKGLISAADFDNAQLSLVEAEAQLVRAKINVDNNDIRLKDTIVRSPINGIILTKMVEEGQIISSGISSVTGGTLIATIANMNSVYIKADVDEIDIGKIKPGMPAQVIADAFPEKVFTGKVIRIAAQAKVEQNVTSFEVTIQVDNPEEKLKAGMNASVTILVADRRDILMVPNEAIMSGREMVSELMRIEEMSAKIEKNQKSRKDLQNMNRDVMKIHQGVLIKEGNGLKAVSIQTGVRSLDFTEITNGLNPEDEVAFTFFSRAKMSSEQFRERMKRYQNMRSGLRSNKN